MIYFWLLYSVIDLFVFMYHKTNMLNMKELEFQVCIWDVLHLSYGLPNFYLNLKNLVSKISKQQSLFW